MLSARLLASGHHYQALRDDEPLPALTNALEEVCAQRVRRIDRFTQLALLGSGRCARRHLPQAGCAVYLGTGVGPLASNIAVQESIVAAHELPMPIAFINTLGSGAAFQVAAQLGLHGPASCQSRRHGSLQAVLASALIDLTVGAIEQALVGVVEEIVLPLAAQRRRHDLAANTPLAEGSHWWLLERDVANATGPRLHWHPRLHQADWQAPLATAATTPVCLTRALDAVAIASLRAQRPSAERAEGMAFHDSIEAAWWMRHEGHDCALLGASGEGTLELFHCLA